MANLECGTHFLRYVKYSHLTRCKVGNGSMRFLSSIRHSWCFVCHRSSPDIPRLLTDECISPHVAYSGSMLHNIHAAWSSPKHRARQAICRTSRQGVLVGCLKCTARPVALRGVQPCSTYRLTDPADKLGSTGYVSSSLCETTVSVSHDLWRTR